MSAFKHIEGEYAIISSKGVYKQVPLAERNGLLYAAVSGGFVQLRSDASTSNANIRLDELSWEGPLHATALGRLCRPELKGSKALPQPQAQALLPAPDNE